MDSLVVISDLQIPYQDEGSVAAVLRFLEAFKPNTLILNGDIVDFTALSRFKLSLVERASLETELYQFISFLDDVTTATGEDTNVVYIDGNHEARLADYLIDRAPELEFLSEDSLSLAKLGSFERFDIQHVTPYGEAYDWHGLVITHGTRAVEHTAKSNLIAEGSSGISGHSHRLSSFFKTDRGGAHAWFECGCLCVTDGPGKPPPGHPGPANWQQGFIVGYWDKGQWNIYPIAITNHSFIFDGSLWTPKGEASWV